MITKVDEEFVEVTADPVRRTAAIASYSKQRTWMFWIACVTFVSAVAASAGNLRPGGSTLFGLMAAIYLMMVFKLEADMRMMRVIDRLQASPLILSSLNR